MFLCASFETADQVRHTCQCGMLIKYCRGAPIARAIGQKKWGVSTSQDETSANGTSQLCAMHPAVKASRPPLAHS
jgi:hypothetical protein